MLSLLGVFVALTTVIGLGAIVIEIEKVLIEAYMRAEE